MSKVKRNQLVAITKIEDGKSETIRAKIVEVGKVKYRVDFYGKKIPFLVSDDSCPYTAVNYSIRFLSDAELDVIARLQKRRERREIEKAERQFRQAVMTLDFALDSLMKPIKQGLKASQ